MGSKRGKKREPVSGRWAGLLLAAVVLFVAAAAIHVYLSSLEAQGGQGRIHWLIAIAYRLGGKTAAVLVLAIPGAICLVLGLAGMMKTAAAPWPCPDCGADIPRKATTREQVWWGGGTCPECGCEVDRRGQKREPSRKASSRKEAPRPRTAKADRTDADTEFDSAPPTKLPSDGVRPGSHALDRGQRAEREEWEERDDERRSRRPPDRPRRRDDHDDRERRRARKPSPAPALMYWLIGGGVGILLLGSGLATLTRPPLACRGAVASTTSPGFARSVGAFSVNRYSGFGCVDSLNLGRRVQRNTLAGFLPQTMTWTMDTADGRASRSISLNGSFIDSTQSTKILCDTDGVAIDLPRGYMSLSGRIPGRIFWTNGR